MKFRQVEGPQKPKEIFADGELKHGMIVLNKALKYSSAFAKMSKKAEQTHASS
ncbi:hypothetical protein G4P54_01185 [Bacillus tequilensis]|uniref:Uncharacterized protein n=1 Tax=Bacillus tequilensis TaxID=227866 RepID=A0A6H0WDF1_9BACI|nr:hypothetical protein G4P54_01185 [Bacillus tequilensis]